MEDLPWSAILRSLVIPDDLAVEGKEKKFDWSVAMIFVCANV